MNIYIIMKHGVIDSISYPYEAYVSEEMANKAVEELNKIEAERERIYNEWLCERSYNYYSEPPEAPEDCTFSVVKRQLIGL